jgi:hypothetical protein
MKNLRVDLNISVLCIIFLSLMGCQSSHSSICESTTNPFPQPSGQADDSQYNPNIEINKVCSFTGEVERGQIYRQKIKDDLVFCLIPNSFWVENGGWTINVGDEIGNECADNFAGIVTPPFHGYNATFVQGWQFRNETNTADSKGNATRTRYFNFIFNQSDFEAIFNSHYPDPAVDNLEIDVSKIPRSRGIFTIKELKLGNLVPNEVPWIETMKFEVKIYLSAD